MISFLTSRVQVDLDTDIVPDRLVKSIKTALAARFVIDVRLSKFAKNELGFGCALYQVEIMRVKGAVNDLPYYFTNTITIGNTFGAFQMVKFKGSVLNVDSGSFISEDGVLQFYGMLGSDDILLG